MTTAEGELLQVLADNDGAMLVREVTPDVYQVMRLLMERGYVAYEGAVHTATYRITEAGRVALADFQQARDDEVQRRAEKEAKEKRDQLQSEDRAARERRFSLISVLIGAIIGSIVAFLLEHHAEIWDGFLRFLGLLPK